MAANPIVLGNVTFTSIESPNQLPIGGGEQATVVTKLSGGGLVVASMGAYPDEFSWSGTLWNPTADARRDLLRSYMVDGKERLLTWKTERFYVKVKSWKAVARGGRGYEYTITVQPTRDANGSFTRALSLTLDQQTSTNFTLINTSANTISLTDANIAPTQSLVTNANLAIQQAGPLSQASASSIQTILAAIAPALAAANTYLAALSPSSTNLVLANQIVNTLSITQTAIANGATQKTVTVMGGTLEDLASQYYGDPSLASDLATINGLSTTDLPMTVATTLRIPPFVSQLT